MGWFDRWNGERDVPARAGAIPFARPASCPPGSGMTRAQIETVAEAWAARAPDRSRQDWLPALLEAHGGEVRPDPGAPMLVVALRPDRFAVSAAGPWPMAEALGHVVLHLPHVEAPVSGGSPVLAVPVQVAASGKLARAKAEAAWFAATLLMPEDAFRSAWVSWSGDLARVARQMRVPLASAAARALHLGLR